MLKYISACIFLMIITSSLYADNNNKSGKKIAIAIMDFRTNNTREGMSRICEDILAEKLFYSKIFRLMEKRQMDRIARMNGFMEFNSADPSQTVKLGKILNVEKMIVGSITYLDYYKIDVRVLDVSTGEVEFIEAKKFKTMDQLDDIIGQIAETFDRYYLGYYRLSGRFDITAEFAAMQPAGTFNKTFGTSIGAQASIAINNPLDMPFDIQIIAGYYNAVPRLESIQYARMFSAYLGAAYSIDLARNIKFIPSISFGYLFTMISYDKNQKESGNGIYEYKKYFFYDPAYLMRLEFDIFLTDRWYLAVTPQYSAFYDSVRLRQFVMIGTGIKMLF